MKKLFSLLLLASVLTVPSFSHTKDLPKIAIWDLVPREVKATYADELTAILVSEISKLEKYEVYSRENVRTLAGWTAEKMQLGCTDTKCLTALGQMDIAKLISGSVGKIGNRYSVSLNLFDTQNARAEKSVSEFGHSEDELIDLVQTAVRKLLGSEAATSKIDEKRPEKPPIAEIKIGIIYPLPGNSSTESDFYWCKDVVNLAMDIVNTGKYKNWNLPLSKGSGLPNLGGAKVTAVFADSQGRSELARTQAERLIKEEKVIAFFGAPRGYYIEAVSTIAEHNKIPFLNAEISPPKLTQRGFKWFFQISPHTGTFFEGMFLALNDLQRKRNFTIQNIALLYEEGSSEKEGSRIQRDLAAKAGYKVIEDIEFRQQAKSIHSEALRLKTANPDIVLPIVYPWNVVRFCQAFRNFDYTPKVLITKTGWEQVMPELLNKYGRELYGVCRGTEFSNDLIGFKPLLKEVNEELKRRSNGMEFDGERARCLVGFLVLCDAINRAGSTKSEAIREALLKTNIPAEQLITPWRGVKFNEHGQNILADTLLIQYHYGEQRTIWPFQLATADMIYPIPKWSDRKSPKSVGPGKSCLLP